MTRKDKAIADTKQAIANLEEALITLRADGASDAARQPYLAELRKYALKLQRLEQVTR